MNRNDLRNSMGIITTRKCPACGHHETGYISEDGSFKPLRPGDMISIIHSEQQLPDDTIQQELSINMTAPQEENDQQCLELWVPETFKTRSQAQYEIWRINRHRYKQEYHDGRNLQECLFE